MSVAKLGNDAMFDGIDLDRVIIDPDYRRRVIEKLRADAALRSPPTVSEPAPAAGHDD